MVTNTYLEGFKPKPSLLMSMYCDWTNANIRKFMPRAWAVMKCTPISAFGIGLLLADERKHVSCILLLIWLIWLQGCFHGLSPNLFLMAPNPSSDWQMSHPILSSAQPLHDQYLLTRHKRNDKNYLHKHERGGSWYDHYMAMSGLKQDMRAKYQHLN